MGLLEQEDLVSILMSVLCGSIIGFEREYNNKSAGFRTIILICLGSTIFTIVSKHGAGSDDRIAANIITGIGFIGAGVIFKDKLSVLGLTTAAVIWTAAGIGMMTGIGFHLLAFILTLITIIVLWLFNKVEYLIDRLNHSKMLNLKFIDHDVARLTELEEFLKKNKISSKRQLMSKVKGKLYVSLDISGSQNKFNLLDKYLISHSGIEDFH